MIKKILLGSLMLLSLHSFAQESTASPYSFYGVGELRFKGTVENKSMGSLGILPDSIHMNLQNPASFSSLKLTSFTVAGNYNATSLKTESASEKVTRTSLDYIALAFPAGKLGFSFGMMPYSSVGYKIGKTDEDGINSRYTGSGGLNRVFAGAGYQITNKLSAGVNFEYNFGKIETIASVFGPTTQYGSREVNTSQLNGLSFNTGLIYKTKLKKYDVISSLTLSPGANLKANNVRNTSRTISNTPGFEGAFDPVESFVADSKVKLPSKVAFGAGVGEIKKWFVGFESTLQQSSDYGKVYQENVSFEGASKFALGGYFVPNYASFSNYFKKITYRAGFRYENTGLIINSEPIKDSAFTLGLGLPVGGSFSNINLGLEVGKKGTTNAGLVQENYMNLSIGLSFNDRWFVKRKYE